MKKKIITLTSIIMVFFNTITLAGSDLTITSITPPQGSPGSYGLCSSSKIFTIVVKEVGTISDTQFTVTYQQGANLPVSSVINCTMMVGIGITFALTDIPYILPAVPGSYPIKMWVTVPGDVNHSNDTVYTTIVALSYMPQKRLLLEEATGTWCGSCPSGIVYGDSLLETCPDSAIVVAVHNSDPMTIYSYDAFLNPYVPYYPSFILDRRHTIGVSSVFSFFNNEKNYFGFADITFPSVSVTGGNLNVDVAVKPAINLSGDYRVALILTQDSVHNTSSSWNQTNGYSGGTTDMSINGMNFQTLPNPVPASMMYYDHVARYISSNGGDAGSMPSMLTAGSTYTHHYSVPLTSSWALIHLNIVCAFIGPNDTILNANTCRPTLGTTGIEIKNTSDARIYPNPVRNRLYADFEWSENSAVTITDALGNVVLNFSTNGISKTAHGISFDVETLPDGLYFLKIQTGTNCFVKKFLKVE